MNWDKVREQTNDLVMYQVQKLVDLAFIPAPMWAAYRIRYLTADQVREITEQIVNKLHS